MPRNSFVRMEKLHDVRGRVDYITNPKRQEHLYATCSTTVPQYWELLSKQAQHDFWRSHQSKGKCIEARELIIALPEHLRRENPGELLKTFTLKFHDRYGMQCTAALHHNKAMTNYHIHLIFSERELLKEPVVKTATRNMFFDEEHRHVRTKKQIQDEKGNIRPGCVVLRKGLPYEMRYFSERQDRFKDRGFIDEVKAMYTDLVNEYAREGDERLQVFDKSGPYLPTKKIGKNNPRAAEIKADNELRKEWNQAVDQVLIAGGTHEDVIEFKHECVTSKVAESVKDNGHQPGLFASILQKAITVLREYFRFLMMIQRRKEKNSAAEITPAAGKRDSSYAKESSTKIKAPAFVPLIEPAVIMKAQADYMRLQGIQDKLNGMNRKAYAIDRDVKKLVRELNSTSWIHWIQRGELEKKIAAEKTRLNQTREQIELLPKQYGFKSVSDFVEEYRQAKTDYESLLHQQEERKASNERKLREYEEQMKAEENQTKMKQEDVGMASGVKPQDVNIPEQKKEVAESGRTVTSQRRTEARTTTTPGRRTGRKKSVLMRLQEKQDMVDERKYEYQGSEIQKKRKMIER